MDRELVAIYLRHKHKFFQCFRDVRKSSHSNKTDFLLLRPEALTSGTLTFGRWFDLKLRHNYNDCRLRHRLRTGTPIHKLQSKKRNLEALSNKKDLSKPKFDQNLRHKYNGWNLRQIVALDPLSQNYLSKKKIWEALISQTWGSLCWPLIWHTITWWV